MNGFQVFRDADIPPGKCVDWIIVSIYKGGAHHALNSDIWLCEE